MIEKASSSWKLVIDLLSLSRFAVLKSFKVEKISLALAFFRKKFNVLHQSQTHFQIPIHMELRPYLLFVVQETVYHFKTQCFDLSEASQAFAQVFAMVSAWAHNRGITLPHCLNNGLVVLDFLTLFLDHQHLLLQFC